MKRYLIAVALMPVLAGCQAPSPAPDTVTDSAVTLVPNAPSDPFAGFVSDDPCGWDNPHVFHSTEMGFDYERSEAWLVPEQNTPRAGFSVHADGTFAMKWDTDSGSFYFSGTWERQDAACVIALIPDGSTDPVIMLGNPVPIPDAESFTGFYTATLVGSTLEGLPDGVTNFAEGHTGDW